MNNFLRSLRELRQYPSAVAGGAMIIALVVIAIYTIIAIPYAEAVHLWRGGQEVWYRSPLTAQPTWTNFFRRDKLPESFHIVSDPSNTVITQNDQGYTEFVVTIPF